MTSFPTSLDTLTNPTATDSQSTVSHADQHINANDAIEALEAKVGVDSSAVATSLDYKVTNVSSSNPGHKHTLATGATDVTASVTEVNYVDGVTSAIQTQINDKSPIASPTFTGTVTIPTPFTLGAVSVTPTGTELNFVDGVTSAIQTQLDAKVDENVAITGATKTKITYDAKGLVTSGADATTADIAASTDKNYVTDAQAIVIGNTSGTNSGDQLTFKTIAVTSGTNPVADTTTDTLNLSAGTGITVTGDETTDTVTIATTITQYTDELAQDAVGGMVNTTLTYTDGTPELKVTNPVTPQAVGFTIAAGTTSKTLTVALDANVAGTNTGDQTLTETSKAITIESPTSTEDVSMFFTSEAITITKMVAVMVGTTPSVTWTIRHGTDRSATGNEVVTSGTTTTSISTGSVITSFNDATIPADSFVWLETTAQSGTVTSMNVTLIYDKD